MACGCNKRKKPTNFQELERGLNSSKVRGLKPEIKTSDLQLDINPKQLETLINSFPELFTEVKVKGLPIEQYLTSPSGKLKEFGFMFYGKFKNGDITYVLIEDYNLNENIYDLIME